MELAEVIQSLQAAAADLSGMVPDTEWYIFGSAVTLGTTAGADDVDVAIVSDSLQAAEVVRQRLEPPRVDFNVHLTFLGRDEARELRFVAVTEAQRIHPA